MANKRGKKTTLRTRPKRDSRFRQLLDMAREGDETASHDLWAEYHFDFRREGRGDE